MPLFTYTDNTTGAKIVRMVPVAQRDKQRGLTRVPEFPTGRLGLAENPYSQAAAVRKGLKELEETHGREAMQRELGADLSLETVKRTWRN
jgi:hypothetical protein